MALILPAQEDTDVVFEETYCGAFELLDRHWLELRATYMEFPIALRHACCGASSCVVVWSPTSAQKSAPGDWSDVWPAVVCRKTKEAVERVLSIGVQSTEELRKLLAMEGCK